MTTDFTVGVSRRLYNKNLDTLIKEKKLTNADVAKHLTSYGHRTNVVEVSQIRNFRLNPSEEVKCVLAVLLGVPTDDIFPEHYDEVYERASNAARQTEVIVTPLSLSSPELLTLDSGEDTSEYAITREIEKNVRNSLEDLLTPKERKVIEMRHGLLDGVYHTLEEVGKEFGVTRERVRNIEAKALEKIRCSDYVKKLRQSTLSPGETLLDRMKARRDFVSGRISQIRFNGKELQAGGRLYKEWGELHSERAQLEDMIDSVKADI